MLSLRRWRLPAHSLAHSHSKQFNRKVEHFPSFKMILCDCFCPLLFLAPLSVALRWPLVMPLQWWASTSPYATSIRSCWICFPSATRTRATRSGRKRVVGWLVFIFGTLRSLPLYSFPSSAFSLGYIRRTDELPYHWARLELVRRCKKKWKG